MVVRADCGGLGEGDEVACGLYACLGEESHDGVRVDQVRVVVLVMGAVAA